jgi:hypothetical protein
VTVDLTTYSVHNYGAFLLKEHFLRLNWLSLNIIITVIYKANMMVILRESKWYLKVGTVLNAGDSFRLDEDKLVEYPEVIATVSLG